MAEYGGRIRRIRHHIWQSVVVILGAALPSRLLARRGRPGKWLSLQLWRAEGSWGLSRVFLTRCPASSILAGLASTSFAGSPPVPCPAAGLQRRAELPTSREIKGYVGDFREFLQEGTFPERKALIRNFVTGIEIVEDEAVLA